MIIKMRDLRRVDICSSAITRKWFKDNGFDWHDFLKNGIESEKLLATKNPIAKQIVEKALENGRQ